MTTDMARDFTLSHHSRITKVFDADTGWCQCPFCRHLPYYVGQEFHAPASLTAADPDPQDTLGCVSTDPVPGPDGWELGGEGG